MKYTDGLFLATARKVAEEFPDIEFEDRIVDNMCMQLVQKPELYDVLVLPNLYGDILSDLAAGLVGGLGVAPGANIGADGAVFEATHGSAPKYKGQNKVNPTALILSGVLMLRHLKETDAADRLEKAVAAVIAEGKDVTYDMKPDRDDPTAVGTREMAEAICRKIAAGAVVGCAADAVEHLAHDRPIRATPHALAACSRTATDYAAVVQNRQVGLFSTARFHVDSRRAVNSAGSWVRLAAWRRPYDERQLRRPACLGLALLAGAGRYLPAAGVRRIFPWSIPTKGCTPRLRKRWSRAAIGSCRAC